MADGNHSIEISVGTFSLAVSGSQEFVEEQFYELYEKHGVGDVTAEDAPSADVGGDADDDDDGTVEKPITDILAESDITAKRDRVLVLGWYLEDVDGFDDFTKEDLRDKSDEAKIALGMSIERDINQNVEDGYLFPAGERQGKDTYWVTDDGRAHLQDNGVPA